MDIRQLRYFASIVETGSVSRASRTLHIAQPALSKQLAQLEDELGVKLLARSVRGVTPTEAGLAVFRHAQAILKQVEATRSIALQAGGGVSGPVAIGLPWTITSVLGLSLLAAVREQLPDVRLEITEGPSSVIAQMLAQGKLDLAVVFGDGADASLRLKPLVREPLRLVGASGSLRGKRSLTLAKASELPLLLLSRPNGIRETMERIWSERGVAPHVVAEINAPSLLVGAVEAGLGFAILPSCALDERLRHGVLDVAELRDAKLTRTACVGSSLLFPITTAAERVQGLLEQLVARSVEEGRWEARMLA
ncbi:MAG TPA: LysR substrate-binding domain-containing protein [Ramlibacter sp.]|uniref:LysR substrate-binding domain-containing protein n=1 Tax=Ramlibacter sp. TaxID=1917967 RepID=UPI002ED0B2DA